MSPDVDSLTYRVIGSALMIHRELGPGLLESVYHTVLYRDLVSRGLFVESKKWISFDYGGHRFENVGQADLVVERTLVIEIKSVLKLDPVFEKQLLTYMRLLECKVGLLLNFRTALMKDGIKRLVHNY
jgi:iron complex transport system substrate-binding protein